MISQDREYRSFEFEAPEGEMRVAGLAAVLGQRTLMGEFEGIKVYEQIDADAFNASDLSDVVLNVDHDGKPAAKTKNGTLKLQLRGDGLYMEADLSKNATGRELHEDIRNGFYDKMSFAFTVGESRFDKFERTRHITRIDKVYDVSAVTRPAYEQTSIQARSVAEAEAQAIIAEAKETERRKRVIRILADMFCEGVTE